MRIAIFTDSYAPVISGVVTSIKMLRDGLEKLGHEVYVITTTNPQVKKELDPHVIRYIGVPFPFKSLTEYRIVPFSMRKVKKLHELNFDVIHVHTEFTIGQLGIKLKKKYNTPLAYTMHTLYEEYIHHVSAFLEKHFKEESIQIIRNTTKKIVELADATFVPSKKILHLLDDVMHADANINIVPTGLDLAPFRKENFKDEDIARLRKELGIEPDDFVMTYVGRIAPEKDIEFLIEAYEKFVVENKNARFLIVGGGYHEPELAKIIGEKGLEDKIIMTGLVKWEEIGIYYHLGDCFVSASTSETQGLTFVEALAAANVVIATKDEAVESIIENGYNGFIYENENDLLFALKTTMCDKILMDKMRKNALLSAQPYSKEEYSRKALSIYQSIVKK